MYFSRRTVSQLTATKPATSSAVDMGRPHMSAPSSATEHVSGERSQCCDTQAVAHMSATVLASQK